MEIRRVVTGHDADGKAVIARDEIMANAKVMPSGHTGCVIWATDAPPPTVEGDEDPALRNLGIEPPPGGTVLRLLELAPGKDAFMHRTDTLDYGIVLRGECVMKVDDDEEVTLKAGDIVIQRGTWHGWENRGKERCLLAFVLIAAQPPNKHLHEDH